MASSSSDHHRLSIVMMGTGPFAVPTFEALVSSPRFVLGLVTRPYHPAHGRPRQAAPRNPMRDVAQKHGIEVYEPENINTAEAQEHLKRWNADLFVVCDYGQVLSRETLALIRRVPCPRGAPAPAGRRGHGAIRSMATHGSGHGTLTFPSHHPSGGRLAFGCQD